jgi:hypothetical protein
MKLLHLAPGTDWTCVTLLQCHCFLCPLYSRKGGACRSAYRQGVTPARPRSSGKTRVWSKCKEAIEQEVER